MDPMGIPVDPIEYGDDCPACTPNPWPAGKTPKHMFATFFDLVNCLPYTAKHNGTILITQDPGSPCHFSRLGIIPEIDYLTGVGLTTLTSKLGLSLFFGDNVAAKCVFFFTSELLVCAWPVIYNILGTAIVLPEPAAERASHFCNDFNLLPAEDTMLEQWTLDSASPYTTVTRLANIEYDVNVLVKYEPP